MLVIVEPQKYIMDLWGKQEIKERESYRLMKYLLRVDYDNRVFLHNIVTGQLVVLNAKEIDILERLPILYSPVMEQLINDYYLVPANYDEHQQVMSIRTILRKLNEAQGSKAINQYTILPTTACNAKCYYCFEQGVKSLTMSEQTANDVVDFIATSCEKNRKIRLAWFGGEPTIATQRISQICNGLLKRGVDFYSTMTTNGYLFDEEMLCQAITVWKLRSVNISVDGMEENYNKIKSYINPKDNPFERVMKNIGLLLNKKISVNLRMNFDVGNYSDFESLLQYVKDRFGDSRSLIVYAHQVNGDFPDDLPHGDEEWFSRKIVELNGLAREAGMDHRSINLPSLVSIGCKAAMDSTVTITPEGFLVRCPEQFGVDQITGNVKDGITNMELVKSWKHLYNDVKCNECNMFPRCLKIMNCTVGDRCCYKEEYNILCKEAIIQTVVGSK